MAVVGLGCEALSSRACPRGPTAAEGVVPALRVGGALAVPERPAAPKGTRCPRQVEEDAGKGCQGPAAWNQLPRWRERLAPGVGRTGAPSNVCRSYSPHCDSVSF